MNIYEISLMHLGLIQKTRTVGSPEHALCFYRVNELDV